MFNFGRVTILLHATKYQNLIMVALFSDIPRAKYYVMVITKEQWLPRSRCLTKERNLETSALPLTLFKGEAWRTGTSMIMCQKIGRGSTWRATVCHVFPMIDIWDLNLILKGESGQRDNIMSVVMPRGRYSRTHFACFLWINEHLIRGQKCNFMS